MEKYFFKYILAVILLAVFAGESFAPLFVNTRSNIVCYEQDKPDPESKEGNLSGMQNDHEIFPTPGFLNSFSAQIESGSITHLLSNNSSIQTCFRRVITPPPDFL